MARFMSIALAVLACVLLLSAPAVRGDALSDAQAKAAACVPSGRRAARLRACAALVACRALALARRQHDMC